MNRPVRKNEDFHGNAPDSCPLVLLLVDVLNEVDFPGNSQLLKSIRSLGKNISALKRRCKDAGIPAIYVNVNRDKMALGLFRGLVSLSSPRLAWLPDGQPVNSRSIRLHCIEA